MFQRLEKDTSRGLRVNTDKAKCMDTAFLIKSYVTSAYVKLLSEYEKWFYG